MAYDETLAARIRALLDGRTDIVERRMFGGLAFLADGHMCFGVHGQELIVRLVDAEMSIALARPHVRPMDLTGRPLRGFVFVSLAGARTTRALERWIGEGLRFVKEKYRSGADKKSASTRAGKGANAGARGSGQARRARRAVRKCIEDRDHE